MVQAASKIEKDMLYDIFLVKDYENDLKSFSQDFYIKYISVFDHGISEQEYAEGVIFYNEDTAQTYKYIQFEKMFIKFYLKIYNYTKVYAQMFSYKDQSYYVTFESEKEYLSHVLLSIREQLSLSLFMPYAEAIIEGNYDLTHCLKVKKNNQMSLNIITDIAKEQGLHILE